MDNFIQNIYETKTVVGRSGKSHELKSEIDPEEGEFLFSIIRGDSTILKTLEVGCAHGLSSLHICAALRERPGVSHTIIDPYQNAAWDGVGISNLESAGIDFFDLIETKSEFALPKLLEKNKGPYDFIFLDGYHTFDHTLLDSFYATRLLRVGGFLAIDDVNWPSVSRVVDFLKNYPCYEETGSVGIDLSESWQNASLRFLLSPVKRKVWSNILSRKYYRKIFDRRRNRMVALKKIAEDERKLKWHNDAF